MGPVTGVSMIVVLARAGAAPQARSSIPRSGSGARARTTAAAVDRHAAWPGRLPFQKSVVPTGTRKNRVSIVLFILRDTVLPSDWSFWVHWLECDRSFS